MTRVRTFMAAAALVAGVTLVAAPAGVGAQEQRPGGSPGTVPQQLPAPSGQQSTSEVLVDVSSILGSQVRDSEGQRMGTVDRLIADPKDGRISYAVIATGGVFGVGRDHVQVPWQNVELQRDGQTLVVTMDRQVLEQAPVPRERRDTGDPGARSDRPAGSPPPATRAR